MEISNGKKSISRREKSGKVTLPPHPKKYSSYASVQGYISEPLGPLFPPSTSY